MSVSMIAAVGKNLELGKGNDLIWHFHDDMKFFKATTTGNTVIMGRKTFESLPHALPNRQNIVLTNNRRYIANGAEVVFSVKEALAAAENEQVFIIGGGRIYAEFLEYADKLFLTKIDAECPQADTFFPEFKKTEWQAQIINTFEEDNIKFQHILYERKI